MILLNSISYYIKKFLPLKAKTLTFDDLNEPIWLYLGAGREKRKNYVGVDVVPIHNNIVHDCTEPFPLENNSVERILTEDMLEHFTTDEIINILNECYRILKPDGIMIIGVPDYNNPKDKPYLLKGTDERFPDHKTLTSHDLMDSFIKASSFKHAKFHHYWDKDYFHMTRFDYSLGFVRRTPDNDKRNRKGNALVVTSILIELRKNE